MPIPMRPILGVLLSLGLLVWAGVPGSTDSPNLAETKFLASDGEAGDNFGFSVAISGDTAVVGADYDMPAGYDSGSAYVFVLEDGSWIEQAKLVPADGGEEHAFGWAVDVEGDTAVVGAKGDDDNGPYSGSVYVYVRAGGVWSQQTKLLPSDGEPADGFGFSVALDGDTLAVGAWGDEHSGLVNAGAAYVFVRQGTTWSEEAKLVASDPGDLDNFGAFAAIDQGTVAIGAPFDDDNGTDSGSAYVFRRSGTSWTEEQKLLAEDGEAGDSFGFAVELGPIRALIGAAGDDDNGDGAGAAYLYDWQGTWIEAEKLLASDGAAGDSFGFSASLSGDRILVGAFSNDQNGVDAGAAYAFEPALQLTVSGSCPGAVTVTVSGAPANSEIGVVAAANNGGWTKGGRLCSGTWFEIGEPFQLPPVWISTDANGAGSAPMTLAPNRCWLEALSLQTCETSAALQIP